jgi:ring-1,2-phenylacetyl-CoA epoxidase subunit PaaE
MDEVFICGPEAMITATETALLAAGVPAHRVYTERFTSGPAQAAKVQADSDAKAHPATTSKLTQLRVLLDGKQHDVAAREGEFLLDAALNAGLDLPYSCKGGVCCTCRCKVVSGQVSMDKNFTLEADEVAKGFVLSCQARALTPEVVLSYDER